MNYTAMQDKLNNLSQYYIQQDNKIDNLMNKLGVATIVANNLFLQFSQGSSSNLSELGHQCLEIRVLSDALMYELLITEQISIEEIEERLKTILENLNVNK